jgi:hypothetical protein
LISQSTAHAQGRIQKSQTFQLAPGLASFYEVGRVDADGTLKLKYLGPVNFGFRKSPMLTEGDFIGVGSENPRLIGIGSHFFRVQVKSVLAGGNLEAQIEKAAVAHFENMNIVGLFRRLDRQLTLLPEIVPLLVRESIQVKTLERTLSDETEPTHSGSDHCEVASC